MISVEVIIAMTLLMKRRIFLRVRCALIHYRTLTLDVDEQIFNFEQSLVDTVPPFLVGVRGRDMYDFHSRNTTGGYIS